MSAVTDIPLFFPTEYDANWRRLVGQKLSRLKKWVTFEKVTGKEKKINQVGGRAMQRITTRAGATRISDQPLAARWLRVAPFDDAALIDEWDDEYLGQIALPDSSIMLEQVTAYELACDDIIIAALGGTAYTGEIGVDPVDLPNSQKVGVSFNYGTPANSGLTLAKLIKAKSILGKNELDKDEQLVFVHTQQQLDDLLINVQQVQSADYNSVKALVDGTLTRYMGFTFEKLERLPLNAGTDVRSCYAFAKSGVAFSDSGRSSKVSIRNDLSDALQIRVKASLGATRTEEKKVVEVACDESP